ncbi:hypothetical protein CY34DRAFT_812718 [Suillus luteus UH-Slu-Lm8-n1]|uniref:Uncharacterized protein n=1 Tax=Suillus luteus UH-Slu-Lm8-n1 TaxID=930992 RepID=A0A0C9ZZ03_9AGAM|nr:hypothetical protein CY34DRAFT_812718 [Suillus luteus UH-Slu-Lm8-n1]
MITRLHAMYSQSKKILIFLIAIFLAVNITGGVITAISMSNVSSDELILSGTYQCTAYYKGNNLILNSLTWILPTVWEVLTLCLAVWSAVQHFRELHKPSTGWFIKDCSTALMILMKTHVVYFAGFVAVSCFNLVYLSPAISAVRRSITEPCVRPRFTISTGHVRSKNSDLYWFSSDFFARTEVCNGTTAYP